MRKFDQKQMLGSATLQLNARRVVRVYFGTEAVIFLNKNCRNSVVMLH